jgi:hypothetical protein
VRDIEITFDRRSYDVDNRLHVTDCILTAAQVNPYMGSEIPGGESLDPNAIYQLYRTPDALKAAVSLFENLPLMIDHIVVSAADPKQQMIIGSVSNARWSNGQILGDIAVWDGDAIKLIESNRQKDLSVGYRYVARMTPGTAPDGTPYDGVMLSIKPNHIALVTEGRVAGAQVGDASLDRDVEMDADIDTSEEKIDRSAFLFMSTRKPEAQFAQCLTCAFFIKNKGRCENFGPDNEIRARGSCGGYAYGPDGSKLGKPMSRMTPTEAGYVERKVRCEDCKFFDPKDEPQTHCDLYTQLNLMMPSVFALNRYVTAYDCCNANTEGARDPSVFKPLGPVMHPNVTASDSRRGRARDVEIKIDMAAAIRGYNRLR